MERSYSFRSLFSPYHGTTCTIHNQRCWSFYSQVLRSLTPYPIASRSNVLKKIRKNKNKQEKTINNSEFIECPVLSHSATFIYYHKINNKSNFFLLFKFYAVWCSLVISFVIRNTLIQHFLPFSSPFFPKNQKEVFTCFSCCPLDTISL